MNEQELDDILNTWQPPPASRSLRERVRASFAPRPPRRFGLRPRTFLAAAAFAAIAFLLIVPGAHPQPAPTPPWTLDSEFLYYADDGSPVVEMMATSYMQGGNETILSRWAPSNPMKTAMWQAADAIAPLHNRVISSLKFDRAKVEQIRKSRQERMARSIGAVTGCGPLCISIDHFGFTRGTPCVADAIVAHDTILGHPTDAVRTRWTEHGRMTLWMAPDLGCVTLRSVYEAEQPDGSFKIAAEKRAVKITTH